MSQRGGPAKLFVAWLIHAAEEAILLPAAMACQALARMLPARRSR